MKKNLILVMVLLLGVSWYVTVSTWLGNGHKINKMMEEAKRLESQQLYIKALDQYDEIKTFSLNNQTVDEAIADVYFKMGDYTKYKRKLSENIATYGPTEKSVTALYNYHKENSSQMRFVDEISSFYKKYPDNELVQKYYDTVKGIYKELYASYSKIESVANGYFIFTTNEKKGLLAENGDVLIEPIFDELKCSNKSEFISVLDNGSSYVINYKGYKIQQPEDNYEFLGELSQQRVLAKKNGKYGYLDSNLKEKIGFQFDDATNFLNGVAAVQLNGKWGIIKRSGEFVTDCIFDTVAVSESNFCSINEVINVAQQGKWFSINTKGETISEEFFEEMKAFESEEPCAVCKDGKWGFMDENTNVVIPCSYEQAKSFVNGSAGVCKNLLWGFIDENNYLEIDYSFDNVGYFNKQGLAPVSHQDSWTLAQRRVDM